MAPHWFTKLRSLYADEALYAALPEKDRFHLWSAAAPRLDHDFGVRTAGKVLLDLGCGWPEARTGVQGFLHATYVGVDFLMENRPDVVASIDRLSFRDESVDSINCLSVLEHVFNPREIIAEMFRVLRCGGCARIQVPFLVQYHAYPDDYFRYTHSALQRMFEEEGFKVVILETDWTKGTYLNAAKMLEDGSWCFLQRRWRFLTRILSMMLFRLSVRVDRYYAPSNRGMYHAIIMLVEKPGQAA
jgi:predicted SAM-dependent methyltransferase